MDKYQERALAKCLMDYSESIDGIANLLVKENLITESTECDPKSRRNGNGRGKELVKELKHKKITYRQILHVLSRDGTYEDLMDLMIKQEKLERQTYADDTDSGNTNTARKPMTLVHKETLATSSEDLKRELKMDPTILYFSDQGIISKTQEDSLFADFTTDGERFDQLKTMLYKGGEEAYQSLLRYLERPRYKELHQTVTSREKEVLGEMRRMKRSLVSSNLKLRESYEYTDLPSEINILLLGKTGSGKSSTGNMICGKNVFRTYSGLVAGTSKSQSTTFREFGRTFNVMDSPGLFDTRPWMSDTNILNDTVRTLLKMRKGIHVFIVVSRSDLRATDEEKKVFSKLTAVFEEPFLKHSLLVMTHAAEFAGKKSLNDYLEGTNLEEFFSDLGGKAIALENSVDQLKYFTKEQQRDHILKAICEVVSANGGDTYTNKLFQETEKLINQTDIKHLRPRQLNDAVVRSLSEVLFQKAESEVNMMQKNGVMGEKDLQQIHKKVKESEFPYIDAEEVNRYVLKYIPVVTDIYTIIHDKDLLPDAHTIDFFLHGLRLHLEGQFEKFLEEDNVDVDDIRSGVKENRAVPDDFITFVEQNLYDPVNASEWSGIVKIISKDIMIEYFDMEECILPNAAIFALVGLSVAVAAGTLPGLAGGVAAGALFGLAETLGISALVGEISAVVGGTMAAQLTHESIVYYGQKSLSKLLKFQNEKKKLKIKLD